MWSPIAFSLETFSLWPIRGLSETYSLILQLPKVVANEVTWLPKLGFSGWSWSYPWANLSCWLSILLRASLGSSQCTVNSEQLGPHFYWRNNAHHCSFPPQPEVLSPSQTLPQHPCLTMASSSHSSDIFSFFLYPLPTVLNMFYPLSSGALFSLPQLFHARECTGSRKNKTKIPYQTKSPSMLLSFAHHLFIAPCKRRPHKQPEAWLSQKYKVNCITDSFHHSYTHTNRKTSSIQKGIHTGPAVSAVHADASKTYYRQTRSCSCAVTESQCTQPKYPQTVSIWCYTWNEVVVGSR